MRHILTVLLGFILFTTTASANAMQAIGTITELTGNISKTTPTSVKNLQKGDEIFLNDELKTATDSRTTITFIDETSFALGENTNLTVDDYVYDPENDTKNTPEFTVTKVVFHYISGLISKNENPDTKINLDFGSISIRGTQIWRDMIDGKNGMTCRVYVEDGQADVFNTHGKVTLGHGDGTKILGSSAAPSEVKKWSEEAVADIKSKTN